MTLAFSSPAQRFDAARDAYQAGRPADAVRLLDAVLRSDPRSAPANHLLGLCRAALGDVAGAEAALRASLAADRRRPAVHAGLGEVLDRAGRAGEAEKAYRAGLALDRRHLACATGLAELLITVGRPIEALQVTHPMVLGEDAPPPVLTLHAEALKRLGRLEESLAFTRRAVAAGAPFAELEAAGTLRDLGLYDEAHDAAQRALAAVGEHPAVLVVLGRTLQDLGRHDEAEAAYKQALTKVPFDPTAHQALADLLWSRTADPAKAARPLESVLAQRATSPLLALRAKLFTRAGQPDQAYALLAQAVARNPGDPLLQAATATAAVHAGHVEIGYAHAEQAQALAPDVPKIRALMAETSLAAGRPERAAEILTGLLKGAPEDQQLLALQALAWRLTGDPRYRELYDYEAMVKAYTIPVPPGWPSLEAYLADLSEALTGMHAMRGDPLDQSLRNGTQTEQNLALSDHPVLKAFFQAVDEPIARYTEGLGRGRDPLRARNGKGHRVKAAWSVRLQPDGFHADHLHPDGWLSSAFYVDLPPVMQGEGRQGWIKFGQPGAPTSPALEAEHFVKPEPGLLVLFPSYMWHGTMPFAGDQSRLTMAFDVLPGV